MAQEKFIKWSLMIFTAHQMSGSIKSVRWAGQGRACGLYGEKGKCLQGFGGET